MPIQKFPELVLHVQTDAVVDFTVKDSAGAIPSGIGSWAGRFTVKEKIDDTTSVFDIAITLQDITNGKVRATIPGSSLTKAMTNAIGELTIWTDGVTTGYPDIRMQVDVTIRSAVRV